MGAGWDGWPGLLWWAVPAGATLFGLVGALLWWRATAVRREVEQTLRAAGRRSLRRIFIPDGVDGQLYLECVLLTPHGLVVLDLRDVRGAVFGAEKMDEWTVLDGSRRFKFRNPLVALHDRVLALRHLVGDAVDVQGRIVFSPRAEFPKGVPPRTVALRELAQELGANAGAPETLPPPLADAWSRLEGLSAAQRERR